MIKMSLQQIAQALQAELIGDDRVVDRVCTDSRADCKDALFIALQGPHFDAHEFADEAVRRGAIALMVERPLAVSVPQIVVRDTLRALGQLAAFNRRQLNITTLAITGSSGKTTVKEMLASILSQVGETFATHGNLNNHIGVPLSLLELDDRYQYAVLELGANQAGDIAYTAPMVGASAAVINNVAAAHLEGFGDLQGVATAKGEIYQALAADATAVVNRDDDFAEFWLAQIHCRNMTFAANADADVTAHDVRPDAQHRYRFKLNAPQGSVEIHLPIEGRHNVNNALAAATLALAIDVPLPAIAQGLAQTPRVSGRLMPEQLDNGCLLIDDSYNANMASMRAAIELLASHPGRRILVMGDMAELGEQGHRCHEKVGEWARTQGIDALYTCGDLSRLAYEAFAGDGAHHKNKQTLIEQLLQEAKQGTTLLIKGSRSARMEEVVQALMDRTEQGAGPASNRGGDTPC